MLRFRVGVEQINSFLGSTKNEGSKARPDGVKGTWDLRPSTKPVTVVEVFADQMESDGRKQKDVSAA